MRNNLKLETNKIYKIGDNLIEKFKNNLLTLNDLKLLKIFFNSEITQSKLDEFLVDYDIEVAGGYKALMLSYFMRMYPELNFTKYEYARLKGVFNYFRFQNMKLISRFIKIGKNLNNEGIPIFVLKGFAMKCLRPELSRAMGDIDILVPENKYLQTIDICKKLGYRLDIYVHSIDIHEPSSNDGIMDIHRYIYMGNNRERRYNKFLMKRCKKINFNGIEVFIPSNEDLLFMALINLSRNLKSKTSKPSSLYSLFDCKYLIESPNFNWDIVIQNIKLTNTADYIAFAIKFINNIIPNLFPQKLSNHRMLKNRIYNYCIQIAFSNYFLALQKIVRKIKLKHVTSKNIGIFKYISLKIHYKFCKFIVNKQFTFAKMLILEERERVRDNAN